MKLNEVRAQLYQTIDDNLNRLSQHIGSPTAPLRKIRRAAKLLSLNDYFLYVRMSETDEEKSAKK